MISVFQNGLGQMEEGAGGFLLAIQVFIMIEGLLEMSDGFIQSLPRDAHPPQPATRTGTGEEVGCFLVLTQYLFKNFLCIQGIIVRQMALPKNDERLTEQNGVS